jgi:hypothetical protein
VRGQIHVVIIVVSAAPIHTTKVVTSTSKLRLRRYNAGCLWMVNDSRRFVEA